MTEKRILEQPERLWSRGDVLGKPCPVPAAPGVYAWYMDGLPNYVPLDACVWVDGRALVYVGISPKKPPRNGAAASRQNLRTRLRYHYQGNAEGSTLRLTLGCLLRDQLGTVLRRVGSGRRRTFGPNEADLSAWMEEHTRVAWVEDPTPWDLEERLIHSLDLPLNLDQNRKHRFHTELSGLRSQAKRTADAADVLLN